LPRCAYDPLREIGNGRGLIRSNGFSSNGPREKEPTKYWLSTLPEYTPIEALVDTAKLRWRIERDYEELRGELGLAHFEGRSWRGFHHHAAVGRD
jgi:SRSO17 transposase